MVTQTEMSLVHGPQLPSLLNKTIGQLVDEQAERYGDKTAVIVPWQHVRYSFRELRERSRATARALLASGILRGDTIAILAGNRIEYVETFLGAAKIGCPLVVLNNTYTPSELVSGLARTSARILIVANNISNRSLQDHIIHTRNAVLQGTLPDLKRVIVLASSLGMDYAAPHEQYSKFVDSGKGVRDVALRAAEDAVRDDDVVNVQFTSGTTGLPKAAMLTHRNILNNGHYVGCRMNLTPQDIVCCPPPLFHCFGLVMGLLNTLSHGCAIVFPADTFNASLTLDAVAAEGCTALLGVPTMFLAQLAELQNKSYKIQTLRLALGAGSMVPVSLQERLWKEMGIGVVLIAYGMTEISPVAWMMDANDPRERRTGGLGKVMPHTSAKVVDQQGRILPRGMRGEMCISGYSLMQGYLDNVKATNEAMRRDKNGVLWMHTGDECVIDEEGYAHITGRIKDMIIRGGENIYPAEIEEQLAAHPAIFEASVVGLPDARYGEVVSAFLRKTQDVKKPADSEIKAWVGQRLGKQKVPVYIFWVGPRGDLEDYPKTGSGKIQKNVLVEYGRKLLEKRVLEEQPRARL